MVYDPLSYSADTFITFTGITDIGQLLLVLTKDATALINLLLDLSIYLVTQVFQQKSRCSCCSAAVTLLPDL
jgi:hypothetical protein